MNLQRVEDKTFVGAQVQIDGGVAYIRCKFINCTVVFTGLGQIQMQDTTFENPNWAFTGPAGNVISFLRMLYANGQQAVLEKLFETIRTGAAQPVPGPSAPPVPPNPGTVVQ
jgi:hypothetical protein